MDLNHLALARCERLIERSGVNRVSVLADEHSARIVDCGIDVKGSLAAGIALAEICLAGLGEVSVVPGDSSLWSGPSVAVRTDQPVAACMASQYAGWQLAMDNYFAMGSGPMRAANGRESLFDSIGFREQPSHVVGVLETGQIPPASVREAIADDCGVSVDKLTLLTAPTASLAGTIQVVARSIETCLHKMHEIGFDISLVQSGFGTAPLPPVAADDLTGIGRTNDAILYGGQVTLWVDCDDDLIAEMGPGIPSCSSADYGSPFAQVFERYNRDFYRIDPLLFSPAVVALVNLASGRMHCFGQLNAEVLHQSFSE